MATETPTADYTALLETLQKIQKHDFTILKLRASVSPLAPFDTNDLTQSSDASVAWDSSTPTALQADLSHYKVRSLFFFFFFFSSYKAQKLNPSLDA
jgi:hypothetical protein